MNLASLDGLQLEIEGRNFDLVATTDRAATPISPAFTLLEIRAAPALRIDIAVPEAWNGKLYVVGNGGYAGEDVDSPMRDLPRAMALAKGFVVAGSNTGHDADVDILGAFAADPEKLVDYAHRAVHQTALVAKAVITGIFGRPARYAYFEGCSTGGRQALMAAQRYPTDFDGIVCGAPVFDLTSTQLWGVRTAQLLDGAGIGAAQMRLVAEAIARKYGAEGDLLGALAADPKGEQFDVLRDVPRSDTGAEGLTQAQAEALAAVYSPVGIGAGRTFPGQPIGGEVAGDVMPGLPPASGWQGWYYNWAEGFFALAPDGVRASFGESFLRDFLGARSSWRDFDFSDAALATLPEVSALLDATQADLTPFAAAGGKLVIYHGLADAALNAMRTLEYYEAVRAEVGEEIAQQFVRFYLPPGMFHCTGGYGPDRIDFLTALTAWVENGEAPDRLISSQMAAGDGAKPMATRPLWPYPRVARYDGTGDPSAAASYG